MQDLENKKLHICIVSREYPPETLWGGIGTFTYNLAHGLKDIGHQVDVIAFTCGEESTQMDDGIMIHRTSSPRIPFLKRTLWDLAGAALFPFSLLYSLKLKKKIQILHKTRNYDVLDFPEHIGEGFFTIRDNRLPSLVRLYTPLSLIGKMGLHRSTNRLDYYLFGLLEKSSIRNATAVNSPSQNLADLVKKEFGIQRNIELIYNPIDTNRFSPNESMPRHPHGRVNVLFVGRLEDRKGAHILARAIPQVVKAAGHTHFTFLGRDCNGVDGFKSMKEYMLKRFQDGGCTRHVTFADPVPYDALVDFYRQADILAVPSLYDNSPYTCLEAMACGTPVVGTSAGGMPEYIDHDENGLIIPPADPDRLAEALLTLINSPGLCTRYGHSARQKAVGVYNRKVVAGKISQLYLDAMKRRPGQIWEVYAKNESI